jgi:hypothetical protein
LLWLASSSLSFVLAFAIGWLWVRRARPRAGTLAHDTFVPREWQEHFEALSPEDRLAASLRVCRKVFATVPMPEEEVERAMTALADRQITPDLRRAIRALVERIEGEYDALVGGDEGDLSCSDPLVNDAFVRARAATALLRALEGDQQAMAYEAWFVLDDLDEVRRLVRLSPAVGEPT